MAIGRALPQQLLAVPIALRPLRKSPCHRRTESSQIPGMNEIPHGLGRAVADLDKSIPCHFEMYLAFEYEALVAQLTSELFHFHNIVKPRRLAKLGLRHITTALMAG
jgi:hypothetical protein